MHSTFMTAMAIAVSALLEGCAVVEPAAYGDDSYYSSAPVYVERGYGYYYPPAPVYVPPPQYVGPPVRFRFDFGYWSGGGRHWQGGHHWDGDRWRHGFGWGGHLRHR